MIDVNTAEYVGHAVFWWVLGAGTAWVFAKARELNRKSKRIAKPGSMADLTRCPRCLRIMPAAGEFPNQIMHRSEYPFILEYDCPFGCGCRIVEQSGMRSREKEAADGSR